MMSRRKGYKRGFPVGLLVGLEESYAAIWQLFSEVAKPQDTLKLETRRTDAKALYNFHESIVEALKPTLKEGAKTIIIASPPRTAYSTQFLDHVRKHHSYLRQTNGPNMVTIVTIEGSADDAQDIAKLVKTKAFKDIMGQATSEETDQIVRLLEKSLCDQGNPNAIFSLEEIERLICGSQKNVDLKRKYLVLSDQYLKRRERKNRINRLLQISKNKNLKTRVVDSETPAGQRIEQFGGIVLFNVPAG